jgi:hypothetical protein
MLRFKQRNASGADHQGLNSVKSVQRFSNYEKIQLKHHFCVIVSKTVRLVWQKSVLSIKVCFIFIYNFFPTLFRFDE